jgi:pSer/pThr/pTyr-binding forkhead associated (FHA) protein
MPYIQLDEKQFPLRVGEARLGGPGADVPLPGGSATATEAVVQCVAGDRAFIRRAREDAQVRVNGVRLGAEPTPLFHGDKIEIAGLELLFGDDRSAGSTQFLEAAALRGRPRGDGASAAPLRPTASTGGRHVSLMDGREYVVPASGVSIGRDAACDVVVASSDVSRRHAELLPGEGGYTLRDLSTNGVSVNDQRIDGERLLGRGDVLRVGTEEFRFYADEAAGSRPVEAPAASEAGGAGGPRPATRGEVPSLADTMTRPAFVDPRPVLASLEIVNQGVLRGRRFDVRTPLAHVGRGVHNDVVVADDSVSETHAKLQKREAGWFVVDMDSTNGTYVAGKRIRGEQRLDGAPDVRFGGVKMSFQPGGHSVEDAGGTRAIAGARAAAAAATAGSVRGAGRPAAPATADGGASAPAREASGGRGWLWAFGLAAAGATAFYLFRQGR